MLKRQLVMPINQVRERNYRESRWTLLIDFRSGVATANISELRFCLRTEGAGGEFVLAIQSLVEDRTGRGG